MERELYKEKGGIMECGDVKGSKEDAVKGRGEGGERL